MIFFVTKRKQIALTNCVYLYVFILNEIFVEQLFCYYELCFNFLSGFLFNVYMFRGQTNGLRGHPIPYGARRYLTHYTVPA